ncbi:MAG: hypothetical protein K2N75_06080 [Helicobacter sp.]|uniref:hypothetical protein n=1 Tax=Helicobacter sp. TaxID=218 RepID=UPI0023D673A2|nr:hypothetical protein [Helicobacter sp.]MDE7175593.1 hypothetical protein [Helicobacter sp.]
MEDIEKLKKIGAREISKHTHMALNKIQFILDSNFEALQDHTTTIGLIKILEREYNVNLQKWQEEYNEFWNNRPDQKLESLETVINFKVTHEVIKQNNSQKYLILSAIIILFLGVGFYAWTNFSDNSAKEIIKEPTPIESQHTNPDTELENMQNTENNATENVEAPTTSAKDESLPTNTSLDASASAPLNEIPQVANTENAQDSIQSTPNTPTQAVTASTHKLEIVPRSNVWVGIVYLDTRKKTSLLTSNSIEIDLTRPQTIITGHGMLDLNNNGELTNYNKAEKMLFLVDEAGNFSEITLAQYNQHTRGLGW